MAAILVLSEYEDIQIGMISNSMMFIPSSMKDQKFFQSCYEGNRHTYEHKAYLFPQKLNNSL